MKICVYAIAKNEAQFVARFCESAKEADLIMIGDTGSTDGTIREIVDLKQKNIASFGITISPWRFDLARNAVMAMIPKDIDVCVSLDLDEVLTPGWRQEIENVWKLGETTRLRYLFNWGGPTEFYYEKIHARHGYKWHHPCHEYPMPYGIEEKYAQVDKLLVVHKADPSKSRSYYFDLLELSVKEDPDEPRNAFYFARECTFKGFWQRAIDEAKRYLALPKATWVNERAYAYRVIGESYMKLGQPEQAELAYMQATREAPGTREPWIGLAHVCYKQERWPECYAYALRALAITNKEKVYTVDHDAWGYKPHLYACLGAWYIGLRAVGIEHAEKALELEPNEQLLIGNLATMKKMMEAG